MRLFLSSYGVGNQPERLVDLLGDNKRVAVITNASDYHPEEGILERLEKDRMFFQDLGLHVDRLDLRNYFYDNAGLREKLLEYGLIWVRGGNAFVLRRAMAQSGFDTIITELLKSDSLAYGGYSAGTCVLSPTLKGVELCDDPEVAPVGYQEEVLWDGLNLIGFSIAPHYKSDHPETEMIDRVVEYFEHNHLPYEALHDGEAIVIDGNKQEKLA
jgi:dipeptidase E